MPSIYKMRKPRVKNKYNLTISKIKKLKIKDRSQVCEPLLCRNNVISSWCIHGHAGTDADVSFCTDNEFFIGIYDEDAPAYLAQNGRKLKEKVGHTPFEVLSGALLGILIAVIVPAP